MNIAGVQPLSLLDYPEMPCSIIFTQGCAFRCSYCHNPELIPFEALSPLRAPAEVLSFLEGRKEIIDAVCITGGEPTLQRGLVEFIATLKSFGFLVKLDTNGIRPDVVERVITDALVDYIAMDLKAPWGKYLDVIKRGTGDTIEACKKTFSLIQNSSIAHEFRTTVLPGVHTAAHFFEMVGYLNQGERYVIQKTRFGKTLEPLDTSVVFDADTISDLRTAFPSVIIEVR